MLTAGNYEWTGVAASAAIRMQELRPSFRQPFGSSIPRPRISLEVLNQNEACLTQHDKTSEKLAGGVQPSCANCRVLGSYKCANLRRLM